MYPSNKHQHNFAALELLDVTLYAPTEHFKVNPNAQSIAAEVAVSPTKNNDTSCQPKSSIRALDESQCSENAGSEKLTSENQGSGSPSAENKNTVREPENNPQEDKSQTSDMQNKPSPSISMETSMAETSEVKPKTAESKSQSSRKSNLQNNIQDQDEASNKPNNSANNASNTPVDSLGSALINKFDEVELDYDIAELQEKVSGCEACSLAMGRQQVIFGQGNSEAKILIICDRPTAEEDKSGMPIMGQSLDLLVAMLKSIGLTLEDVFITNIVKCHSKFPITTMGDEVIQCRDHLEKQLNTIEPKLIWVLGEFAAQALLDSEQTLSELRGRPYHYSMQSNSLTNVANENGESYVTVVSYHPSHLLKNPNDKRLVWQDLKYIAKRLGAN